MKTKNKIRLKAAGVLTAGIIVATVGYGFLPGATQTTGFWQKIGQTVSIFPKSLTLDLTDNLAVNVGTSTVNRSYDGFMAGGGIASASMATDTQITLYTHSGNPALCDSSSAMMYADSGTTTSDSAFAPTLSLSVGTTTASGVPTTNLLASSTLATTTDAYLPGFASLFRMNAGEKITAMVGDVTGFDNSSSTGLAAWDIEYQTHCWLIGG